MYMANRPINQPAGTDEYVTEQIKAGCPMLIHASSPHPIIPGAKFMRCTLGWSVYSELSQARCAATNAVENCWRVHPERTPITILDPLPLSTPGFTGKVAAD